MEGYGPLYGGDPPKQFESYISGLAKLGAKRIEWRERGKPDENVEITLCWKGIVPSGESKSIVFFRTAIPSWYEVVPNTDGINKKGSYYSRLSADEPWFICHQYW